MVWHDYLKLLLEKYADKPNDFVISIGSWDDEETIIKGIMLPEFKAYLSVTVGELRLMA